MSHSVKSTIRVTVVFVLFLILSAGVFFNVAVAQSSTLQLGEGDKPSAGKKTLDLAPVQRPVQRPAPGANAESTDLANLVRTQHGDWEVACEKSGKPCVMAQIGNDSKGTPIMEMVLRLLPEPQEVQGQRVVAVTDIITPLGVVLTSGLMVQIDSQEEQRAPFQICTEQGCLVREPLTEEALARFKKGANAKVTVVAANQGPVDARISLRGFTKAFNALK